MLLLKLNRVFCQKRVHSRNSEPVNLKNIIGMNTKKMQRDQQGTSAQQKQRPGVYFVRWFGWLVGLWICSTCYADICDLENTIVFQTSNVRGEVDPERNYALGNSYCSYNGALVVTPDISVVGTYSIILETYCKSSPEIQQNNYFLVPENSTLYYCNHPYHTKIVVTGGDIIIPVLTHDM